MSMTCSGCGEQFRSLNSFDTHRIGAFAKPERHIPCTRRCMTPAEMLAAGMSPTGQRRVWSRAWQGYEITSQPSEAA